MAKDFQVVVTIDKTPATDEEKKLRLAQYWVLLHKWKQQEKIRDLETVVA